MNQQVVLLEKKDGGIAVITLNRPHAANALSLQMLSELQAICDELRSETSVRCVVITGAGGAVFCAGADLKERASMSEEQARQAVARIGETIQSLEALPKPVIAAMQGVAFGGGLELALACDIRMASHNAQFGLTETSLGILPGAGGTQRLPRLVGIGRAKELIFTARRITAEEALQIGLVEFVTPAGSVLHQAMEIAGQIVRNAPLAIAGAKLAIDQGLHQDIQTGLGIERQAYEAILSTKDRLEGLLAFREKRHPIFKGE
ncbi:enoyl-CoA hydratase [Paenibacillus aestuarii]|uniref:Enoyl-CoA hydratase n=1 Tax=Paenibacillus aestuarii TaxID=516965 RepID=A0ABW0KDA9_9BACL|nr:enoyl-CoA hydratase [Paenibacillus aestuarii]